MKKAPGGSGKYQGKSAPVTSSHLPVNIDEHYIIADLEAEDDDDDYDDCDVDRGAGRRRNLTADASPATSPTQLSPTTTTVNKNADEATKRARLRARGRFGRVIGFAKRKLITGGNASAAASTSPVGGGTKGAPNPAGANLSSSPRWQKIDETLPSTYVDVSIEDR
jgi:hypothetical protein